MTKVQTILAELPIEKKKLFTPIFGNIDKFYTTVYLIARNEHVTEQEKPDRYEDRLQVIRQIRIRVEKILDSFGLDGTDLKYLKEIFPRNCTNSYFLIILPYFFYLVN